MVEEVEKIKQEHLNNYKEAAKEIVRNNNKSLFIDDINQLLQKPPLDSMDLIKSKLLSLTKKYHVILDTEKTEKMLEKYRKNLKKGFHPIGTIREEALINVVDEFIPVKKLDTIKITKKTLNEINKQIKKESKIVIENSVENDILKQVHKCFLSNNEISDDIKNKIKDEFSKYMTKKYPKQLLENIELKIFVKDTTLINGIKEQGDRYLFTNNNSYIFKEQTDC